MNISPTAQRRPVFVLFCESVPRGTPGQKKPEQGAGELPRWRFVLRKPDGMNVIEAMDTEPEVVSANRLTLLAAVRGLEALDQPSDVRLLTPSRYVARGLRYGMDQWRDCNWMWEHFGEMVPIRNDDLWRRVDRAMRFHRIRSRMVRVDRGHQQIPAPAFLRRRRESRVGPREMASV